MQIEKHAVVRNSAWKTLTRSYVFYVVVVVVVVVEIHVFYNFFNKWCVL